MDQHKLFNRWRIVLIGAGAWWLSGANLFFYHAAALLLFLEMMHFWGRTDKGLYIPPSAHILGVIVLIYSASIALHLSDADTTRVIAALYNLSFWIFGTLLVIFMANQFRTENIPKIFDAFYGLSFFIALTALAILVFWLKGVRDISFPTPLIGLARYLGDTNLVRDSLWIRPLMWDWFASVSRPRFNVFSPYPTAAGGCIMITLLMMMARASYLKKMTHPPFLFLFGGCFIGFLMTLSRISLAGFFLGLVVVLLVEKKHFPIWIVGILVVSALCFPLIESFSEWIMGLREGSTSVRFSLYRYSLEQLHDTDWILGLGVKPRENIFAIPLGSHSTYISMIFKTGVFGVTGVLLLQASLLLRWVRLRAHVIRHRHLFLFWRALGMVMIAMAVWMATEDIDAPQFLAFLYFSMIGCFEGLRRECLDGVS